MLILLMDLRSEYGQTVTTRKCIWMSWTRLGCRGIEEPVSLDLVKGIKFGNREILETRIESNEPLSEVLRLFRRERFRESDIDDSVLCAQCQNWDNS